MTEASAPGEKKGPWQGRKARDFADFQEAVNDVLKQQDPGSTWIVKMEVKKIGNPIHDYRIVLSPSFPSD